MVRLLRGGSVTIILSLMALMLFAACSSDGDSADTGVSAAPTAVTAASTAVVAAPVVDAKPVETRLVISASDPVPKSTYNPWAFESPRGPWFYGASHESLIGSDPITGAHIPQLAESWAMEPDGTSVRFQLRKGVRFHGDNGDFSAQDIVATMGQHIREDSQHTHRSQYRAIEFVVVNDYEIIYQNANSNPEILNNTSAWNVTSGEPFSAVSLDKLNGDPDAAMQPPAGTGAYQFVAGVHGMSWNVERVPYDHWRYTPDWEEIEFRWINENSTRMAGLLAGEIHLTDLPSDQIQEAASKGMVVGTANVLTRERAILFQGPIIDKSYANYKEQGTACGYAWCDSALLDVKVRKALSKAIDRDAINAAYFNGTGIENHNPHFLNDRSYWNPEWDTQFQAEYGYDPAAAKALLSEAGYGPSNPLEISLEAMVGGFPEEQDLMETAAGYFAAIGVKPELDQRDSAAIRPTDRSFGWVNRLEYMSSNIVDLQAFRVHHWSGSAPRGGFELKELDTAIDYHREIVDSEEVFKRLRQTGDTVFDLHIAIPLHWIAQELIYNPDVIASYEFSGVPLGPIANFEQILAVKK